MPKQTVVKGDKWDALECIAIGWHVEMVPIPTTSTEFQNYEPSKYKALFLKCRCGKEKIIPVAEFKGKRLVKDCGCGCAAKGRKVSVCFTLAQELRERVIEKADRDGRTLSHTVSELIHAGLREGKE